MKKSPASKKSPKTTKRVTAKVAKKPAAKSAARKTAAKKKSAGARKSTARQERAAFAFDPRLVSCGCCCPGALGAGMCGEPEGAPKVGRKRRK